MDEQQSRLQFNSRLHFNKQWERWKSRHISPVADSLPVIAGEEKMRAFAVLFWDAGINWKKEHDQ
jgi:hypothetical protein